MTMDLYKNYKLIKDRILQPWKAGQVNSIGHRNYNIQVIKKSLNVSNRPRVNSDVWSLNIALSKNFSKKLNYTTYGEVFIMNKDEKFLTPKELSEMLNLSISKLAYDRMRNVGIPFFKYQEGHRFSVRYPMFKVREFINNNMKAI